MTLVQEEININNAKIEISTILEETRTVVLLNNLKNNNLADARAERQKKIQTIFGHKKNEEIKLVNFLEACNVFMVETFLLTIGFEEFNLPNYMVRRAGDEDLLSVSSYKQAENYFYVSDNLSVTEGVAVSLPDIEIFDQIIEIDSRPVEEFISTTDFTSLDTSKVNMKLVKNLNFKIFKLKSKWKNLLKTNNSELAK